MTELAGTHTAMVVRDVGADVLGVVEAESRPVLEMFSATLLTEVGWTAYDEVHAASTATTCAASTSASSRAAATA